MLQITNKWYRRSSSVDLYRQGLLIWHIRNLSHIYKRKIQLSYKRVRFVAMPLGVMRRVINSHYRRTQLKNDQEILDKPVSNLIQGLLTHI